MSSKRFRDNKNAYRPGSTANDSVVAPVSTAVLAVAALVVIIASGCTSTPTSDTASGSPSSTGEACNFATSASDGCDDASVCVRGTCEPMCSDDAQCGSSGVTAFKCLPYTRFGTVYHACTPTSGAGAGSAGGATTTDGGDTSGCRCLSTCQNCKDPTFAYCLDGESCVQQSAFPPSEVCSNYCLSGGAGSGGGGGGAGAGAGAACTPQCGGRVCGNDGCGGLCGTCAGNASCNGGTCVVGACQPHCGSRICGSDGCSGTCGSCGAPTVCSADGNFCVNPNAGCPAGTISCSSQCCSPPAFCNNGACAIQ